MIKLLIKLFKLGKPSYSDRRGILIIAPRLPEYDRAAGDLRLFRILEILKDGYPVFYYNDGMWERFLKRGDTTYLNKLADLGITVVHGRKQLKKVLRSNSICAVVCEFYHLGLKYNAFVRRHSPSSRLVVDSVDVHFLRERTMAATLGDMNLKRTSERTRTEELGAYNLADDVWVASSLDRDVLVEEQLPVEKIHIVPTIHRVRNDVPPLECREPRTLIFVGGFAHQPNVDAVEFFHREILPLVRSAVPGVMLRIVGDSPPEKIRQMAGADVEVLGFVTDTQPHLDGATVSIAPLRYGAGLKGKVGEALAAGLPLVTTSIGAQGMGLVSGRDAFVADEPADFAHAIIRLLREPELWRLLSENGRTFMQANFGYESVREDLNKFFLLQHPVSET